MRVLRLLLPVLALCYLGMAERPPTVSVRFFGEANARDGRSFSQAPIKIGNPPRDAFLEKIPVIHERQIASIYPFKTPDGTWGCAFRLDHDGRINLEVISTERRGSFLVAYLGTKKGNHRMADLMIDRTVRDGVISIPRGITELEIAVLAKQFKVIGGDTIPKLKTQSKGWNPFGKKALTVAPAVASTPAPAPER